MATLQFSLMQFLRVKPSKDGNKRAREFANWAYKKTGGPTPDLKRVYGAYLANERRRAEGQRKG